MEIKEIKACPLLGVCETEEEEFDTLSDDVEKDPVTEVYECMGTKCINFEWITTEGYCTHFQRYTGHEKE